MTLQERKENKMDQKSLLNNKDKKNIDWMKHFQDSVYLNKELAIALAKI